MPNQTASSGASVMTRDLGDARYSGQKLVMQTLYPAGGGSAASATLLTAEGLSGFIGWANGRFLTQNLPVNGFPWPQAITSVIHRAFMFCNPAVSSNLTAVTRITHSYRKTDGTGSEVLNANHYVTNTIPSNGMWVVECTNSLPATTGQTLGFGLIEKVAAGTTATNNVYFLRYEIEARP
jgi:hypothetical protein